MIDRPPKEAPLANDALDESTADTVRRPASDPAPRTKTTAAQTPAALAQEGASTRSTMESTLVAPSPRAEDGALEELVAFHKEIRGALEKLASVVGNARNGVHDAARARHLVEFFEGPLLWHDEDEEVSLLRRMRAHALTSMQQSIVDATHKGHDKMEQMIDDLLAELRAIAKGAAAFDLVSFEHNARSLKTLLDGHLTLEEGNLFPLARELLADEELHAIAREMHKRHGRPSADSVRSKRAVPL